MLFLFFLLLFKVCIFLSLSLSLSLFLSPSPLDVPCHIYRPKTVSPPATKRLTEQSQSQCATDLTTLTTAITTTYALTSCLVQQINCPASYAQIVQVVNTETVTTTSCPAAKPTASSDDGPLTDAPQIPVAPATLNNLAPLPTVDGSGIVASLGSITAATPAQPTITGEFVPITASDAGRAGGNGWVLLMGAPVAVAAFMAFM